MSDIYSHSSKSNAISVFMKNKKKWKRKRKEKNQKKRKEFVNNFLGKKSPPLKKGGNKIKNNFR